MSMTRRSRGDILPFLPDIPALIIELKELRVKRFGKEEPVVGAIEQIKERKYDDILQHYRGSLLFVGINYDPDTKEHTCMIEPLTN